MQRHADTGFTPVTMATKQTTYQFSRFCEENYASFYFLAICTFTKDQACDTAQAEEITVKVLYFAQSLIFVNFARRPNA